MTDPERVVFLEKELEQATRPEQRPQARQLTAEQMQNVADDAWPDQLDIYRIEADRLGVPWNDALEQELNEPKDAKGNVVLVYVNPTTGAVDYRDHQKASYALLAAKHKALQKPPADDAAEGALGDDGRPSGSPRNNKPDFLNAPLDEVLRFGRQQRKAAGARR